MKVSKLLIICFLSLCISPLWADITIEKNGWLIAYDEESKTFDYSYNGKDIFLKAYPEVKYDDAENTNIVVTSSSYANISLSEENITDNFGSGTKYTVKLENPSSDVSMEQVFYFYEAYDYFLTEVYIKAEDGTVLKSNHMAPIVSNTSVSILPASSGNRMLMVPWSNDGFKWYHSNALTQKTISYEATSIYNGDSREGLVVGSVTHDTWKSAIRADFSDHENMDNFICFSGISDSYTWDHIEHGKVKGSTITSARFLVGFYDDWREGMDAFGHANTLIVPARTTWQHGTPIGWNSWGVLANHINYQNISDVSLFFAEEMYEKGFHNEQGKVIIDLDSFWDNISAARLAQFAQECKDRGQIPGLYWTPFSLWWDDMSSIENNDFHLGYKLGDAILKVNGKYHKQGGFCYDPTHPAVHENIRQNFEKFKKWGFEYIKLDFVMDGAIQADSYFNEDITTAIQAYNEGSQVVLDAAGDDMFIALSIAPTFPYQYGNSRRISCDSWGKIDHSKFVLNALSFGWWTEQFNQYNDPDHIVLRGSGGETEGENRARLLTGAMTGMLLLGDNYSDRSNLGDPVVARERALTYATNPDLMEITRLGRSFKPVYGNRVEHEDSENFFMLHTDEYLYLACVNYSASRYLAGTIPLDMLDITEDEIESIVDIWTGDESDLRDGEFYYQIRPSDGVLFKIKKGNGNGIESSSKKEEKVKAYISAESNLVLVSDVDINKVEVYNVLGNLIKTHVTNNINKLTLELPSYRGLMVVKTYCADGQSFTNKVVVNN